MFSCVAKQLSSYQIAYLHIMDGLDYGFHNLCQPVDLYTVKLNFQGPVIGNVSFNQESAEGALRTEAVDLIAFGRPFISNPVLVERIRNGWPIHPNPPQSHYYGHSASVEDCLEGYLTYKPYKSI